MAATTGRRRSSIGRMISALAPKRSPSIAQSIDLSALEIDLLASYQLSLEQPLYLGPLACHAAHVVGSEDLSERIRDALFKAAVINPAPVDENDDYLPVDTSKISRNFASQLPFTSGFVLRRVVALLFIWEEQCVRLRLLQSEERELRAILSNAPPGLEEELTLRLRSVTQRCAMLPSEQMHETTMLAAGAPPAYS